MNQAKQATIEFRVGAKVHVATYIPDLSVGRNFEALFANASM